MTSNEWITLILSTNALTLAISVFVTNTMIKKSENEAKEADRLRDATIESIKNSEQLLERKLSNLDSKVSSLEEQLGSLNAEVKEQKTIIIQLRNEISSLHRVISKHKSLIEKYEGFIEQQYSKLDDLENKLLKITENLSKSNDHNSQTFNNMRTELDNIIGAINVVQRAIARMPRSARPTGRLLARRRKEKA